MICEGCIKQDTCKYKEVVEAYEADGDIVEVTRVLIEPLEATLRCRYKQTYPPLPPNCTDTDCDTTTDAPDDIGWKTYTA